MFGEDDHLNRSPSTGRFTQVWKGLLLPALIAAGAVWCLFAGKTPVPGRSSGWATGSGGAILALSYLAGAGYLHFRYYWEWSVRLEPHSRWPKLISLTLCIFCFVLGIARWFSGR
jgi:hypothetical protein